jgi:hypothetical protein
MSRHNRERRKRQALPGYAGAVLARAERAMPEGKLRPGNLYTITLRHDARCDLLSGAGPCNCNPEVRVPERIPFPQEN